MPLVEHYSFLSKIIIIIMMLFSFLGCTFGEVYVPCIYPHAR